MIEIGFFNGTSMPASGGLNTHSHCAGTRGSVLIREVSLFQWWMNTHSHCAGTRGSVLIREVSLFQWCMNTHSHCAGTRGNILQWWIAGDPKRVYTD